MFFASLFCNSHNFLGLSGLFITKKKGFTNVGAADLGNQKYDKSVHRGKNGDTETRSHSSKQHLQTASESLVNTQL